MTRFHRLFGVATVALVFLAGSIALAVPAGSLIFDDPDSQTGTIGYDADTGILHGIDIEFQIVKGNGTPFNAGTNFLCDTCLLNFAVSVTDLGGDEYSIVTGGTNIFELSGEVPLAGAGPGVLASGTFAEGDTNRGGNTFEMGSRGVDFKNDDLIDWFFGEPVSEFTFVFNAQASPENKGTGSLALPGGAIHGVGDMEVWWDALTNADLTNSPKIPEPATTSIFLLGLGAVAASRRRRT